MADTKDSRDKQAQDQDRRQRLRALEEALERADEPEPRITRPLDEALEEQEYPMTAASLLEAFGDRMVRTPEGAEPLDEVFASVGDETYDSAAAVRARVLELVDGA